MRHIDHIVVAVRDLERAAEMFGRLGFQVGARNQHPWGTENRLIQFGSSFIELITIGAAARSIPEHQPRRFSFGAFVRDYLAKREGIAMLVLSSDDARADAVEFAASGIGDFEPFYFERKGRRPDGAETQVAFTLAFASDPAAPDAGFFVCQQHFPENFWNPSFQRHPNSAINVAGVRMTTPDPARHATFLSRFTGVEVTPLSDGGIRGVIDGGRIEAVSVSTRDQLPLWSSLSVQVASLETVTTLLAAGEIPFATVDGAVVVLSTSLGVELRFQR